jgi:TIR domain-containing protein
MGAVFISYRRGDSEGQARALFIELSNVVGRQSVFMDVDSIALGRDFREALQERLASCDLMLALIGPGWLHAKDDAGSRRLDNPADFVRQEIATALKRNIPVTPVLLQGAQVPNQADLPEDLRDLAYRNAFELSHNRWESDVREMLSRLELRRDRDTTVPTRRWRWPVVGGALTVLVVVAALAGTRWLDFTREAPPANVEPRPAAPPTDRPEERPESPSAELTYAVGSKRVLLTSTVGVGQFGTSRISVDDRVVASGSTQPYDLGPAASLAGKRLTVITLVTDVSPKSVRVGIRYRLSGGPRVLDWTVADPMSGKGRARQFRTSVHFVR